MKKFDMLDTPLEGTNLIEASAGTGKTYTITGLFLRLILEKHLSVNEILVVTFTEAATEELRDRIRTRVREAVDAFSAGQSEDNFLNALIKKYESDMAGDDPGSKNRIARLKEAIRDFDEAAIFTIHGFCNRMLRENAFESGSLFDTELSADQESLTREIVEDFWRNHFYDESKLFVNYVIDNTSPDKLLLLLKNKLSQPDMKLLPPIELPDSSEQEKQFKACFKAVCEAWRSSGADVGHILIADKGLNRKKYGAASVPKWICAMSDYLSLGNSNPSMPDKFKENIFERFTSRMLRSAVKKKCSPPRHSFFDLCEALQDKHSTLMGIFEKRLMGLKAQLFGYAKEELKKRKESRDILSFDDLLLNLHTALISSQANDDHDSLGPKPEDLAGKIRKRFRAALIDEFQDTDPIQYDIFKRIFSTHETVLFLIGDPKQAIYGFRGADIFAYMDAARHAESRYTLGENWRSEPGLITAVNTLFENTTPAFVYDEIPFERVKAPQEKKASALLKVRGKSEPCFHLWFVKSENGKPIPKTLAHEQISKSVAAEISRLVDIKNKACLGNEPLKPGDIAVLVRRHTEANMMQAALSAVDIPAVLHSTGNVFDSRESLEMERVLSAIAHPNDETRLRAALATDMMGISGESLDALTENETAYEEWLIKFKKYHDLWNTFGFIRMFRQLISEEDILPRVMDFCDGERRNTNILHLGELLHQTFVEKELSMTWLVKWLSEQRDPNSPRAEEHQLRLESDENAVRIVTIHKSKGLEYPVVFCPFMFDGSDIRDSHFLFHDRNEKGRLTLDLGSDNVEENRSFAEREKLAENLRLAYVALTRAMNRCYLVWGRINKAETSALAYLFHNVGGTDADIIRATASKFRTLGDADVLEDLDAIQDRAKGFIRLSEMPGERTQLSLPFSAGKAEELDCRTFSGNIASHFRISSFSSLVSGRAYREERADHDSSASHDEAAETENLEDQKTSEDIFSFPKGAKAGIFLHDIFEHLDFAESNLSVMENLVKDKLGEYNFDLVWHQAICDMIQKVLSVPLDQSDDALTLSRVRNEDRLNELEFYFPLDEISPERLGGIFAKYAAFGNDSFSRDQEHDFPQYVDRLEFTPIKGFMKGFIDMVFQFQGKFYLVDWKSNFLGPRVEDYDQNALLGAMKAHFYILQYHIYVIALHQYLLVRKPDYRYERDFGGVCYVFLRGVDPDKGPDFGIYKDTPDEKLINELCSTLIDRERTI